MSDHWQTVFLQSVCIVQVKKMRSNKLHHLVPSQQKFEVTVSGMCSRLHLMKSMQNVKLLSDRIAKFPFTSVPVIALQITTF